MYRLTDELAVIQTLDFFPPVVDDPYDYGAIAAANAISDVCAMGGEVVLAMNIAAFPADLSPDIVGEILRGGAEKVFEAGGVLDGGHTLDDKEPKYGLAVMGLIHPERVLTKAGAQPGDVLVLTKPLSVAIITTALKGGAADPEDVAAAVRSMKRLNRRAAQLIQHVDVGGYTDITGFALLGHAYEMAEKSGVQLRFRLSKLLFLDGAHRYADQDLFPGGSCNNQRAYEHVVRFAPGISEGMQLLLFTPETSGGLLVSVPRTKLGDLVAAFAQEREPFWVVGDVIEGQGVQVSV